MDIKVYEKPVIKKFVTVDGEEFALGELYSALEQISGETKENDIYGEYSLREYEIDCNIEVMNKLVDIGLVKNYTGSRMANLYCMKDKDRIEKLLETLYELDV